MLCCFYQKEGAYIEILSSLSVVIAFFNLIFVLGSFVGGVYLFILVVKALRKYIRSGNVNPETARTRKSLGEVLKKHRTDRGMTQEFVAQALGISRQAVSKWENGTSEPTTTNLIALAKLFGVEPEDLLREVQK